MADSNFAPYLTLFGGGFGGLAAMSSADQRAALLRANAGIASMQAASANEAGSEQAEVYRQRLNQTIGKQAASLGGAGITTSGSALRALSATSKIGNEDIARIQLNAARKAWGFQIDQQSDLTQADMEKSAGVNTGLGSLITSGARAYGNWAQVD